jgi:hypothetical protein
MTQEEVIKQLGFAVEDYFGGCPECGKCDRILNVGRDHWAVCLEQKNKWPVGSNLFSSWRDEDAAIWESNERVLRECVEVDDLPPTDPGCYADDECYQLAMRKMLKLVEERRSLVSKHLAAQVA